MQKVKAEILMKGLVERPEGIITDVVTDSRQVIPGCVFVCFEGEHSDGHAFAAQAAHKGAAYIIGTKRVPDVPSDKMILVENASYAMVQMAANFRQCFRMPIIGVTGSVGKTTTKEFCAAVLSAFGETVKTQGNQNNEIGMPRTIYQFNDSTQYAVVEMGMSNLGEISRLSRAARPSAGIITCIGVSHLANLGTRENILKAKAEICEGLPDGAPLVLNYDDDMLKPAVWPERLKTVWVSLENREAEVWAENIVSDEQGETFVIADSRFGRFNAFIPVMGRHNIRDALQAYAAATRLGLDPQKAADALSNYHSTGLRQKMTIRDDITVIEDCYNASPDSMRAAIETFSEKKAVRHLALLGDMLELGAFTEQAHEDLGLLVAAYGIDLLFAYGSAAWRTAVVAAGKGVKTMYFDKQEDAAEALYTRLRPGDALLVKGSRGMKLEDVVARFWEYRDTNGEPPAVLPEEE